MCRFNQALLGIVTKPLLEILDFSCERDDRVLIKDLSFQLGAGEVLQIEGPNGSGKTTLLRILCGLSDDFEGQMLWQTQPRHKIEATFRQNALYFGHLTGVKAALTPIENLQWVLQLKGVIESPEAQHCAIVSALKTVGLYGFEDSPVYSLSAGQKRRVALARLVLEPAVLWVLDEPFTAIDKDGVAELEHLIEQHAAQGGSVLITTHHALEVASVRKLQLGLGGGQWRLH